MRVMSGLGSGSGTSVIAGSDTFNFKFLCTGAQPVPEAQGSLVTVGSQTVRIENGNLVLGATATVRAAWIKPNHISSGIGQGNAGRGVVIDCSGRAMPRGEVKNRGIRMLRSERGGARSVVVRVGPTEE